MNMTDKMTATEQGLESGCPYPLRPELHRALDAAGIDYWVVQGLTFWNCSDGRECVAYGYQANGKPKLAVKIVGITDPEQAVEATLGRGTCKLEQHGSLADWPSMVCWSCSECGFGWHHSLNDRQFSYCPNCGRSVVG